MLNSLKPISLKYPHSDAIYGLEFDGAKLHLTADMTPVLSLRAQEQDGFLRLDVEEFQSSQKPHVLLAVAAEHLFSHFKNLHAVEIAAPNIFLQDAAFGKFLTADGRKLRLAREEFYQQSWTWHRAGPVRSEISDWAETQGRRHPVRPRMGTGRHYSRYIPSLGKTVSFRTIDIDRDLTIFHAWHNQPRVYDLWELNKPIDELRQYLEKGLRDPHQIPLIVELDDEPAGYFEVYWAAEDRIGPYYEYDPYDRGFHFLIGNPSLLGLERTDAILRSVAHFIFLEDSRTNRIVAEPRADNKKVLKYVQIVPGWHFIKEFDFPHKRAALLMQVRKDFFKRDTL